MFAFSGFVVGGFISSLKTVLLLLFFSLLECRPGSYGSNCSSSCSLYCKEKACDRYSGECLYGCTPGYQKPYCVMRKIYLNLSLYFCVKVLCYHKKKSQKIYSSKNIICFITVCLRNKSCFRKLSQWRLW